MTSLLQDLRYGLRIIARKPGFALVSILTLALGIGANTAIFSVVNSVLLKSLSLPDANQLVVVFTRSEGTPRDWATYPDIEDWRRQSTSIGEMAALVTQSVNLTGQEEPTRVVGAFVSANFFQTLEVEAAQGRTFAAGEDQPGAQRVVVLNHGVWRDQFGSDPALVGRSLILNNQPYTVIGVMPESFRFQFGDADVWLPIRNAPNFVDDRGRTVAAVIGRMNRGVTLEQAQAEMDTIAERLSRQYPDTNGDRKIFLQRLQEVVTEDLRGSLLVLLGVVGCVLLIACANVANLVLSRAVSREKEFSLRAALGAGRKRLIQQVLVESLLLSILGGMLGLMAGFWGARFLEAYSPTALPAGVRVEVDLRVLAFTVLISVLTGLLFGLVPAVRFSRPDLNTSLKEGFRSSESGGGANLRGVLVASQIAISFVLLIGSGLMIRSYLNLIGVRPGFNPENLLTLEYRLPRGKYPETSQQWQFHKTVVDRVRAVGGVESASVVLALPYSGNFGTIGFVPFGDSEPSKGKEPRAQRNTADTYYFDTMQIPLLEGRVFTDQDREGTQPVAIVNRTMAERYWPGQDPIGKQVRLIGDSATTAKSSVSIVGIVGDVKHNGLDEEKAPQIYVPYSQNPFIFATLIVRTSTSPMSLARDVRAAVWSVDKDQPVWKVRTLESLIERSVGPRRFVMQMVGGFSVLALLLASIGIYGVMSYMVTQRTREIGIRVALGATRKEVFDLVIRRAMLLTGAGLAAGAIIAVIVARLMASFLFSISASDPMTFAGVAAMLSIVAVLSCVLPALNAMRVDPMVALRSE